MTSTTIDLNAASALSLVVNGTVTTGTLTGASNSVTNNGTILTESPIESNLLAADSNPVYSDTANYVYWLGSVSTDASDDSNWTVPQAEWGGKTLVVIPQTNEPSINSDIEANIVVMDGASLSVSAGTITGNVRLEGNASFSQSGGTVSLTSLEAGSGTPSVSGEITATTVTVSNGASLSVDGTLSLENCTISTGASLSVASGGSLSANGTLSVNGTLSMDGTLSLDNCTVSGSGTIEVSASQVVGTITGTSGLPSVTGGTLTAYNAGADLYASGWNILSGELVYVWNGNSSTNYGVAENWNTGIVPGGTDDVLIPSGRTRYPYTVNRTYSVNDIEIETGASLLVYQNEFTVNGNLTNAGTLTDSEKNIILNGTLSNTGTIVYTGAGLIKDASGVFKNDASNGLVEYRTGTGTIGAGAYNNLTVTSGIWNAEDDVSVAGKLSIADGTVSFKGNLTVNGTDGIEVTRGTVAFNAGDGGQTTTVSKATFQAGTLSFGNDSADSFTSDADLALSGSLDGITLAGTLTASSVSLGKNPSLAADTAFDGIVVLGTDISIAETNSLAFKGTLDSDGTERSFSTKGGVSFEGAVGGTAPLASIQASGDAEISSSVRTTGVQSYGENVSLAAGAEINADGNVSIGGETSLSGNAEVTSGGDITFSGAVSTGSNTLTVSSGTTSFDIGFSDAASVKITGNASISGSNEFSSIIIDNSEVSAATKVTFEGGTLQKIDSISAKGNSALNTLSLTSGGTWNVYFSSLPENSDFAFTVAENSVSVASDGTTARNLGLFLDAETITDASGTNPLSAENWFTNKYYWFGTNDDWSDASNWFCDADGTRAASSAPLNDGTSEVIIADTSSYSPTVPYNLNVISLTVNDGHFLDLNAFGVEADTIENNGRIRLEGSQTLTATDGKTNGSGSIVEYYGNANSLPWGTDYESLEFTSGAECTSSSVLTVSGTTLIANGTGAISLIGLNSFSGDVSIGDANDPAAARPSTSSLSPGGDVTLNASGGFTIAANAACDSLDVKSAVTLRGDVATSGASEQKYEGDVTLAAGSVLTANSGSGTVVFEGNVSGAGDLTLNGNAILGDAAADSVSTASVSVSGTTKITAGSITTDGIQSYAKNVSVESNAALTSGGDMTFGVSGGSDGAITSNGKELVVSVGANTAHFYGGFSDATKLKLTGSAEIAGDTTFNSLEIDNSGLSSATSITFDTGSTQTITNFGGAKGGGANAELTLTAGGDWNVVFGTKPTAADFEYVIVENSHSVNADGTKNELKLIPSEDHVVDAEPSALTTKYWFMYGFYWFGTTDENWTTASNWYYDEDGTAPAVGYPDYVSGTSEIVIQDNAPNILKLLQDINVASILVRTGTAVDFSSNEVTITVDSASDNENGGKIVNNGRIRLEGSQTLTAVKENGSGSIVEYYGTADLLPWGTDYESLEFTSGAVCANSNTLTVSGTTFIANGTGAISLTGSNTFSGDVYIGDTNDPAAARPSTSTLSSGGEVTLNAGGGFAIAANAACNSLDVKSAVTLKGDVATTTTQLYENNVRLENDTKLSTLNSDVTVQGAVSGSGKSLTFATGTGDVSVGDTVGADGPIGDLTSSGTGANTFTSSVSASSVTMSGTNSSSVFKGDVTSASTIQIAGTTAFSKTSAQTVTSSGEQTYSGAVEITSPLSMDAGNGDITFSSTVDSEAAGSGALSATTSGNILFDDDVGSTKPLAFVSLDAGNATVSNGTSVSTAGALTATTDGNFILEGDNAVSAGGAMTVTDTGYFLAGAGTASSINATSFTQNGTGLSQVASAITATGGISFATDTYVYGAAGFNSGTNPTSFAENLFISAASGTDAVNFVSPVTVGENYALFSGAVSQNENLTVSKDIVLLNGEAGTIYADSDSGVADLFAYLNTNRDGTTHAAVNLTSFPTAHPDGTTSISASTFSSAFSAAAGITVTAGKNFYDNGVDLGSGGAWNLSVPDNDSQISAFAELYNVTVSNCAANHALSAAENCNDGGGNTNVFFSRPKILENNSALAKGSALSGTYTVYDDMIRVEFVDSLSNDSIKIENTNNEISRAVANIKWNDGTAVFEGAYTDAEGTVSTNGKGDISVFYLKASGTWNTDAVGSSVGAVNDESTDRQGIHQTAIPDIFIPKALSAVYETLRDEHKNRIAHTTGGNEFKSVADRALPVLVAAYVGQEKHTSGEYCDSHNFIEFQYSEEVSIGSVSSTDENIRATSALGDIPNSSAGLTVLGLATISSGGLSSGTKSGSGSPHSLYRNFDTGSGKSGQTHRVRVSIAGYVDGDAASENYIGFINSATTPSGIVRPVSSADVQAASYSGPATENYLDASGTTRHALRGVTVNEPPSGAASPDSDLYGAWDTSAPVFTPYFVDAASWTSGNSGSEYHEAVGTVGANPARFDKIEMHLFDNTPSYSADDASKWIVKQGWTGASSASPPDTRGGRSDSDSRGGLRKTSLSGANSAFKYRIEGTSSWNDFGTNDITQTVTSALFGCNGEDDGLYISVPLPYEIPTSEIFYVKYNPNDANAYVTDLAGNRLVYSSEIKTIDVTPPAFVMAMAPVGENFSYMIFTKLLAGRNSSGRYARLSNLSSSELSEHLSKVKDAFSTSGLAIDHVEFVSQSAERNYTILKFVYGEQVTLSAIESPSYLVASGAANDGNYKDVYGDSSASITYIFDSLGNFLETGKKHSVSDFAVNAVRPIYAYAMKDEDGDGVDDEGWTEQGIYGEGLFPDSNDYAVHDFSADAGNYGTLRTGRDIMMQAQFLGSKSGGSAVAPDSGEILELVPAVRSSISAGMASDSVNELLGSAWRLWFPGEFKALASEDASSAIGAVAEGTPAGDAAGLLQNFSLDNGGGGNYAWKAGDEIQFLFQISGVTIDHDGDPDTPEIPLCAVWMENTNVSSIPLLDLWSFKLKDIRAQRGGVTILNNVINVNAKEQTVIQVEMPDSGNLNIYIMTVDGNVVKRLSKGQVSEGTHYYRWDGTNTAGDTVARGLYFVRVTGPEIDETRKVMCVKE